MLLSGRYEVVARNSLLAIGESYVAGLITPLMHTHKHDLVTLILSTPVDGTLTGG
jgi:hypothetical protein